MEVDLLCEKPRVALEIDGPHHLGDPVAYRRDRRKDQHLQENGVRGASRGSSRTGTTMRGGGRACPPLGTATG